MEYENPFADYGNIINGNRFIGRQADLKVVESRVLRPKEAGNLAIIGEPRIGKSSLVWKAVMDKRETLLEKRLLPIWLNLANFDTSALFFRSLVVECDDKLEELNWLNEPIKRAKERALQDELLWSEGYGRIQRFFEKVRQANIRVLFVLDEFDHARILFKNDISGFQGLRELSYRPEWRVNFITTSRRTIRNIELQTEAISTLDGIFHKHYLGMFNQDALDTYFSRFSTMNIPVNDDLREKIEFYCGGYPYLLEMLGYEIVEQFFDRQFVSVESSAKNLERSFLDQYDRLVDLMKEDGTLGKLLQILFGPVIDVKQVEVDDFLRYGLIKPTQQEIYQAFSPHFHSYLQLIDRTSDLQTIWKQTEIELRRLITEKLVDKYGENWLTELEKSHSEKLKPIFDRCRKLQAEEQKNFGSRVQLTNLLDYTYPKELFDIILAKWNDIFREILGKDKPYWQQRAGLLSKVRNPLAHNRDQIIYDYERKTAVGYCEEILEILKQQV